MPIDTGTEIKDIDGNETGYVVTSTDTVTPTVEFVGTAQDKAKKTLSISKNIKDSSGNEYIVTSIKQKTFKGNEKLKKVTIPNTVLLIGKEAFKDCSKLKTVILYANPKLKIGKNAFKNINKDALIKIKGLKGKQKDKIIKALKKQTTAKIK